MTVARYKEGLSFKNKPYKDDERGIWHIYGEDPNCDFSGCHSEPYLVTCQGSFKEVLEYAVTLKRFYTWGSGGSIKKTDIIILS